MPPGKSIIATFLVSVGILVCEIKLVNTTPFTI